jgi:hypothetical protein
MSCERDFFTLKGEKFTFSNNLWSKNPFAKVEKIPFAKESRSDDIGQCLTNTTSTIALSINFKLKLTMGRNKNTIQVLVYKAKHAIFPSITNIAYFGSGGFRLLAASRSIMGSMLQLHFCMTNVICVFLENFFCWKQHYYNLVPRTNTPNEITAGTIFYQTRQEPRAKAFSPFHNAAVG